MFVQGLVNVCLCNGLVNVCGLEFCLGLELRVELGLSSSYSVCVSSYLVAFLEHSDVHVKHVSDVHGMHVSDVMHVYV